MSLEKDTWTHFIRRKKTVVGEKQYKQNNEITYFGRRETVWISRTTGVSGVCPGAGKN